MDDTGSDAGCLDSLELGSDSGDSSPVRDSLPAQFGAGSPTGRELSAQRAAKALLSVGFEADASLARDESGEGHEVWLHVYDLGPVTGKLNEFVLRGANLGAFHCGVEVLGEEWSFQGYHDAWDNDALSGLISNYPRMHPAFIYRESISLGRTLLREEAIDLVLDNMAEDWPANTYHLVSRNCVTFAEELADALQVPEPFPDWVRGAVDAGKQPALFAVADYGWSWFKWWCRRQTEWEAEQAAEAGAAAEGFGIVGSSMQQGQWTDRRDPWGRPLHMDPPDSGEATPR